MSNKTVVSNDINRNIMGYMPCNKLLLTISLPMMMSMLVQALYNIVDSIFVAQINENALTAVSLAFPIQSLMIAVVSGTGVGVNARLSRRLGEKKYKEVNIVAGNAFFLTVFYAVFFLILGVTLSSSFYALMTSDPEIQQFGTDYVSVILIFSVGLCFQMTNERLLQSTGKTFYSMITQATGAIINIIMDPVMIFGLWGFPAMGTYGAALATVLGQCVAAVLGFIFNFRVNKEIKFGIKFLKPKKETILAIYTVGFPSIIMQSVGSVMNFGMNKLLLGYSSTAAAAFGVYFKLQSFIFMPVFGMNNGLVPIISFNLGARKPERIKETYKLGIRYAVGIMTVGLVLFEALPVLFLRLFNASENLMDIGSVALRIIAIHFPVAGYSIVNMSLLQASGHGYQSLVVSVVRQIVILLPVAYILAALFGLNAVWLSFLVAELASVILSGYFCRRIFKYEIEPLYS